MLSLPKLIEFIGNKGRRVGRVYTSSGTQPLVFIETVHLDTSAVIYIVAPKLALDVSTLGPIALVAKPIAQVETTTIDVSAINYGIDTSIVDAYADIVASDRTLHSLCAQVYRLSQATRQSRSRSERVALGMCGSASDYFAYSDARTVHLYTTQLGAEGAPMFFPAVHVNSIVEGFSLAEDIERKLRTRIRRNMGIYFETLQRFAAGLDSHITAVATLEHQCLKQDALAVSLADALVDARKHLEHTEAQIRRRGHDAAQRSVMQPVVDEARTTVADIERKLRAQEDAVRAAYAALERAVFENNLLIETAIGNV